jgi:hypothetical protein
LVMELRLLLKFRRYSGSPEREGCLKGRRGSAGSWELGVLGKPRAGGWRSLGGPGKLGGWAEQLVACS